MPGADGIANGNNAMTDTTARRPDDAAGAPEDKAPTPAETPKTEEAKVAELVETLARESAENKDKLLRALAEMENMRRRTERQVADAREYGIAGFARDVLAVADNMDRALNALDAELREKADPAVKALLDGVELTERELHKVLEKHGVRKLEPKGEKFDPNFHQAMFEVPDPSVPPGTIAQVVQAGYMIGERVLRPALVAIAKGGPKAPPPAEAATEPAAAEPAAAEPAPAEPGAAEPGAAEPPANDNATDTPPDPHGAA
jgi:molecular chaperone GrpE